MPTGRAGVHVERQIQLTGYVNEPAEYLALDFPIAFLLDDPEVESDLTHGNQIIPVGAYERHHLGGLQCVEICGMQPESRTDHRVPAGELKDTVRVCEILAHYDDRAHAPFTGTFQHVIEIACKRLIAEMSVRIDDHSNSESRWPMIDWSTIP